MRPAELEGLVPPEVCAELTRLAAEVDPDHAIVEIGSYKGKSTCALALEAITHVWAVDPWDLAGNPTGRFGFAEEATKQAFHQQVDEAGLTHKITAIQAFSVDAARDWDGPSIGLLYIDGDHSYEAVRADFEAWFPHLTSAPTVVFDDLDTRRNPGVRRAIEELGLEFEIRADRLAVVR